MTTENSAKRQFFQILVETNNGDNEDDIKDLFVAGMGEEDAIKAALQSQLSKDNAGVHTLWFKAAGEKPARMTCANEIVSINSLKEIDVRTFVRDTPLHVCVLSDAYRASVTAHNRELDGFAP
jgi:hypothetical protein